MTWQGAGVVSGSDQIDRSQEEVPMSVADVLNDKVAQELLNSREVAKLAYNWLDGTPRVVPIWFHWDGRDIVMGTPATAPKVKALRARPDVALTIDTSEMPYHVLIIRGVATVEHMPRVVPEYALAAERYFGPEQGPAWVRQASDMLKDWARVAVSPKEARIIDFETRWPSAIAKAIATQG
jgi:PPOX class probable F420-dependent enzyme